MDSLVCVWKYVCTYIHAYMTYIDTPYIHTHTHIFIHTCMHSYTFSKGKVKVTYSNCMCAYADTDNLAPVVLQEKSGAKEAGKAAHSCHKDPEAGQSEGTVEFRVLGSLAACMFNMFNRGHLLSGLLSQLTRMGRICYRKSSYQV